MTQTREEGRICHVPYDENIPVSTSWDLGIGDSTAIWFYQITPGGEIHFIDFYENAGEPLSHYVHMIKDKGYLYSTHNFPHDLKARELGTGVTREEVMRKLGIMPNILPRLPIEDGIQAARSIFTRCFFDEKKCFFGIKHLENYRKHYNKLLGRYIERPVHDDASNSADSFRYASLAIARNSTNSHMSSDSAEQLWQQYGSPV
jgi:hypothetical protein